ncbi:NAD(P)-binding protein [Morchella conica CCBAS932]|uniref:NAD(P)-binding protein n=1 Tax=Morchella conica CCBAS932 TaxID=1392247 RepID=A0A3N4KZC5_9PEZI|nr:NAD(P)-binding protein [Morchella conica CCBAS932]
MFFSREPRFTPKDLPDLSHLVILVTGGNNGIGKESILAFCRKGAKVYMAARTESKALAAIQDIKSKVPTAKVEFIEMDLSSFSSVKKGADDFLSKETKLHVLLNNAGVMCLPYSKTAEGFEIQFGTNHMGHFLLTKLLLPILISTAKACDPGTVRVVNVSSLVHNKTETITFDDMHDENGPIWRRYGVSKLANVLHAKALSKRAKEHGIIAVSLHPGIINSGLWGNMSGITSALWGIAKYFFTTPEVGAYTNVFCSASPKVTMEDTGDYYVPVGVKGAGKIHIPSRAARDDELAEKLWEWSETEVAKHGY